MLVIELIPGLEVIPIFRASGIPFVALLGIQSDERVSCSFVSRHGASEEIALRSRIIRSDGYPRRNDRREEVQSVEIECRPFQHRKLRVRERRLEKMEESVYSWSCILYVASPDGPTMLRVVSMMATGSVERPTYRLAVSFRNADDGVEAAGDFAESVHQVGREFELHGRSVPVFFRYLGWKSCKCVIHGAKRHYGSQNRTPN
jgi:hypothetical protein